MKRLLNPAKLTMQFAAGRAIGGVRFFWRGKMAKMLKFAVCPYAGSPLSIAFVPINALKPATVSARRPKVLHVLVFGSFAKVASSVIQAVTVLMVNFKSVWVSHQYAVHHNCYLLGATSVCSSNIYRPPAHIGVPIEAAHKRNISRVYNSLISTCKRNIGNVAFNADLSYLFSHLASSNLAGVGGSSVISTPRLNTLTPFANGCNK